MVIHAFPAAKLAALLVRQISKPIVNFILEHAKQHPLFRKYICMPPAYVYNWCDVQSRMWILKSGKPVKVPPLNDAMAMEIGASILGEVVIFVVAAGLIWSEVTRQAHKEERKERLRQQELNELYGQIHEVRNELSKQEEHIVRLSYNIGELTKQRRNSWLAFFGLSGEHTRLPLGSGTQTLSTQPSSSPLVSPAGIPMSAVSSNLFLPPKDTLFTPPTGSNFETAPALNARGVPRTVFPGAGGRNGCPFLPPDLVREAEKSGSIDDSNRTYYSL